MLTEHAFNDVPDAARRVRSNRDDTTDALRTHCLADLDCSVQYQFINVQTSESLNPLELQIMRIHPVQDTPGGK